LYGPLGREFGRHFRLAVETPNEAVRALITLRPGLRERMREGFWRVIVGKPHISNATEFPFMRLGSQPLHLVPATPPRGGDGGVGKIAAGVVIIGAAIALSPFTGGASIGFAAAMAETAFMGISYGAIALMGASMVLGGIASMISRPTTPQVAAAADPTASARPEDRPSFMFQGVVNNTTQGGPVPLVFGRHLVGSVVISAGIAVEDI
jgi:predicted phage tail protein